jgi:hypothetical protein
MNNENTNKNSFINLLNILSYIIESVNGNMKYIQVDKIDQYTFQDSNSSGVIKIDDEELKLNRYDLAKLVLEILKKNYEDNKITEQILFSVKLLLSKDFRLDHSNQINKEYDDLKLQYFKSFNKNKEYPRALMMIKVKQLFELRVYYDSIPFTKLHEEILFEIKNLTLNSFSQIRIQSQAIFLQIMKEFKKKLSKKYVKEYMSVLSNKGNISL